MIGKTNVWLDVQAGRKFSGDGETIVLLLKPTLTYIAVCSIRVTNLLCRVYYENAPIMEIRWK